MSNELDRLLIEQIHYYEARAAEYEDLWFRRGPHDRGRAFNENWFHETAIIEAAADSFDAAFIGFFVSHIPPDRWSTFWARLASWLQPGASAFVVDDAAGPGRPYSGDVVADGPVFAHRRRLADGREFTIVKHFYEPAELVTALDAVGWDADIHRSGVHFQFGTTRPRS